MRTLLGVDLGGTNVRVGLVQNGKVSHIHSNRIDANASQETVLEEIEKLLDKIFSSEVSGIGIGVPSVVDTELGIVYDTLNIPSWQEVPLKSIWEDHYHVPVFVNNDANCFVLGESYFGKAKGYRNVAGMVVGTGLGTGLILNGQLYSGSHCGAGEFGVVPYRDGILENYAGGQFFQRVYGVTGELLAMRASQGDVEAKRIFDEFGLILGDAIQFVMYAVDPDIVVLGGSVSRDFQYFENSLRSSLDKFLYQRAARALKIVVSDIEHAAILGAAALCL
ncbi:MAG TPA: ROK family protein [Terriglobia bacterium]|nr:ROK family protein [Terriglobia bacterium]